MIKWAFVLFFFGVSHVTFAVADYAQGLGFYSLSSPNAPSFAADVAHSIFKVRVAFAFRPESVFLRDVSGENGERVKEEFRALALTPSFDDLNRHWKPTGAGQERSRTRPPQATSR